jgi:hypothetical protein
MHTPIGTRAIDPLYPHPNPQQLLVRWFVQYNPLFSASAMCVLAGVLVLQRAIGPGLVLTGVVELYQWLVIGTAALLYRRLLDHRPGVILGLIAVVFLVDPTLQTSALASAGDVGSSLVWIVLCALKLRALAWAFCLRLSLSMQVVPVLGAALVVAMPMLRMTSYAAMVPGVLAVGLFILGALTSLFPMTMRSERALGETGAVMFPRLQRAVFFILVGGALLQGINAVFAEGAPAIFAALMAVSASVAMHSTHERHLWWAALAVVWASLIAGLSMTVGWPMLAVALFVAAARHGHPPRVMVAGLVAACLPSVFENAVVAGQPLAIAVVTFASVGLVWLVWQRRAWSSFIALVVIHARTIKVLVVPTMTSASGSTWGVCLVAAGFCLVPVGVLLHRRLSASLLRAERDAEAARALAMEGAEVGAMSSSAAVPSVLISPSA